MLSTPNIFIQGKHYGLYSSSKSIFVNSKHRYYVSNFLHLSFVLTVSVLHIASLSSLEPVALTQPCLSRPVKNVSVTARMACS